MKYLICDLLEVGYVPGSFVRSSARGVERDRGFVWIVVEGLAAISGSESAHGPWVARTGFRDFRDS
ncbi:MAG: hypothetical protein JNM27_13715 [Leptospirales bacterium]|nr:hypothetical protein [Leptospirales bacterium]